MDLRCPAIPRLKRKTYSNRNLNRKQATHHRRNALFRKSSSPLPRECFKDPSIICISLNSPLIIFQAHLTTTSSSTGMNLLPDHYQSCCKVAAHSMVCLRLLYSTSS